MSATREAVVDSAANGDSISMQVVKAVADARDATPFDLAPLHRSVDTDALDALYDDGAGPRLEFQTNDCRVVVHEDARIVVERLAGD